MVTSFGMRNVTSVGVNPLIGRRVCSADSPRFARRQGERSQALGELQHPEGHFAFVVELVGVVHQRDDEVVLARVSCCGSSESEHPASSGPPASAAAASSLYSSCFMAFGYLISTIPMCPRRVVPVAATSALLCWALVSAAQRTRIVTCRLPRMASGRRKLYG